MLTETIPRFAPAFNIEIERQVRKAAIVEADTALSEASEALKLFQGEHFSSDSSGTLVPRVAFNEVISNEAVLLEHARLVRIVSARHDEFQRALRKYNEL
jgi:hypothetical protein